MKKLLLLALVAAMAAPAIMAGNQALTKKACKLGEVRTVVGVVNSTPAPQVIKNPNHAPAAGYAEVTLSVGDVWGDGSGYQMLLDADATAYGTIIPETGGLTTGGDASAEVYAEFEYKIPENADGAMTTTNILLNSTVTIQIPAGVYDFCITNPTPGDRIWIASQNGNIGGRADDFEFVAGGTYVFTVSFGGQNDQVDLEAIILGMPTLPTELTVEPAATYADVAWVPGDNNDSWNLRYRKYYGAEGEALSWDFEQSSLDGWTTIDADGDGYNWVLGSAEGGVYINEGASMVGQGHSPQDLVASGSYSNLTGVLHPDNYLVSPKVQLGGKITFWAKGQDANYAAETFGVAVSTTDNTDPESFTMVGEKKTSTAEWVQYEFDLSDYAGQEGYVAIRHYDISDMFVLNVDDIEILPAAAEWIEVEDVTSPFTIDGLTPETTYEVQVKAFGPVEVDRLNAAGGPETEWTESTIFTTLAEDPVVGVETVKVETTDDNNYYNLMGQKVTGNLPAGIYIHNGKKVVIN